MIGDFSQGGIKMTSILSFCHALKFSWVKKLLDPLHHAGWKSLFLDKVGNLGGDFWMFSKPALGTDHLTRRGGGMVFCFVQNFFSGNTRVRIFLFVAQSANFFSRTPH